MFDQFVEHSAVRNERGGHRNLFFITPHKAQIDVSQVTQAKAAERDVSILSFLAERDLSDLKFVGWVSKVCNEDLYLVWINALNSDYYRDPVSELSSAISGLKATEAEHTRYIHDMGSVSTQVKALDCIQHPTQDFIGNEHPIH